MVSSLDNDIYWLKIQMALGHHTNTEKLEYLKHARLDFIQQWGIGLSKQQQEFINRFDTEIKGLNTAIGLLHGKEVASTSKPKKLTKIAVSKFSEIFANVGWEKYILALEKTEPPLLNFKHEFIGKPKLHKGVVCSWIKYLQNKGIIKLNVNRAYLAIVLNNELRNLNLGKDGKTFDNVSAEFENDFKEQLTELSK